MGQAGRAVSVGRKPAGARATSHNLYGQKLGRKGRDTRERILAATAELLAEPGGVPITLSAVGRRASLGMTSLYGYFSDLTELVLAVLEPIMASAEQAYVAQLRERWPDEAIRDRCVAFVRDYHAFWLQHSRILHLRNSMSDSYDARMIQHRVGSAMPLMELLTIQMDGDPAESDSPAYGMATALLIGLDRLVAVRTDFDWERRMVMGSTPNLNIRLLAEARLLELGIRDGRSGLDFGDPAPVLG